MPHGASRPVAMVPSPSARRRRSGVDPMADGVGEGGARSLAGRSGVPARSGAVVVLGRAGGQGKDESERQRGEPHALRL